VLPVGDADFTSSPRELKKKNTAKLTTFPLNLNLSPTLRLYYFIQFKLIMINIKT